MTVTNTSLLGLALPTTGTESGVWGDDVNNGLTILIDVSVAGTNNITQDSDITLAVSNGSNSSSFTSTATNSTVAQYYVLNCTGARTANRNIIAPASSKTYYVINSTTTATTPFTITIKKSGGTGVTIPPGAAALVAYNGTDFQAINAITGVLGFSDTNIVMSAQASANTYVQGIIQNSNSGTSASADFIVANNLSTATTYYGDFGINSSTFSGTGSLSAANATYVTATSGDLALGTTTVNAIHFVINSGTTDAMTINTSGALALNGSYGTSGQVLTSGGSSAVPTWTTITGTVPSPFTANGVVYASSTSALATGSALTFDGTNFTTPRVLFGGSTLPAAGNPSIALRTSDNTIYHQSGSANTITFLDSSQNTMQSIGATANIFNISNSEKMRLTSTGLGIGTTNPVVSLDVQTANAAARFNSSDANGVYAAFSVNGTPKGYIGSAYQIVTSSSANDFAVQAANNFVIATNGSTRVATFDTSGNLGLGVTPSAYAGQHSLQVANYPGNLCLSITASGNDYGRIGYNFGSTSSSGSYNYQVSDYASSLKFGSGGFQFYTSSVGAPTAGSAISFTQAMTLDNSGNWKLGTTGFGSRAVISGTNTSNGTTVSSEPSLLFLYTTDSTANAGPEISFGCSYDGTNSITGAAIKSYKVPGAGTGSDQYNHGLIFKVSTYGSGVYEAARIDSSGNLLVGQTSPSTSATGFFFSPNYSSTTGNGTLYVGNSQSTNAYAGINLYSTGAGAYRFYVDMAGTIHATSTSISAISDSTLKTNIKPLETGLTQILALQPRRFDWLNGDGTNVAGFISQEVEQVLPDLVNSAKYSVDENGEAVNKLFLKMGDMIPTMVKAIQELKAEFDAYKASHP